MIGQEPVFVHSPKTGVNTLLRQESCLGQLSIWLQISNFKQTAFIVLVSCIETSGNYLHSANRTLCNKNNDVLSIFIYVLGQLYDRSLLLHFFSSGGGGGGWGVNMGEGVYLNKGIYLEGYSISS